MEDKQTTQAFHLQQNAYWFHFATRSSEGERPGGRGEGGGREKWELWGPAAAMRTREKDHGKVGSAVCHSTCPRYREPLVPAVLSWKRKGGRGEDSMRRRGVEDTGISSVLYLLRIPLASQEANLSIQKRKGRAGQV